MYDPRNLDPPSGDVADHRDDRHPGHRRWRRSSSASTSGSRPSAGSRRAAAHHRLHGLRPRHDLLPAGAAGTTSASRSARTPTTTSGTSATGPASSLYGWFEFWKVGGDPYQGYNTSLDKNDPFGLHIITSGLSITRIPKGNIFIGYTIVNTGPINTSALNTQYSYWLSPKWFGTVAESYDFGNGLLLGASGSLTRIGKPII